MQTVTSRPAETPPATADARHSALADTAAIKLDATSTAATKQPVPASGPCPHCNSPESWGGSAWCPHCGFYPKLGMCIPADAIKSTHQEEEELGTGEIPPWVRRLGIGCLVILVLDIIVRLQL